MPHRPENNGCRRSMQVQEQQPFISTSDTVQTREIYRLVLDNNWKSVTEFLRDKLNHGQNLFTSSITVPKDTVLHLAVHNTEALKDLLSLLQDGIVPAVNALFKKNIYGNTPLHEAAKMGNVEAAKLLLKKCPELMDVRNFCGETAFYVAAKFGQTNVVKFLFECIVDDLQQSKQECTNEENDRSLKEEHAKQKAELHFNSSSVDAFPILHVAIRGQHLETALWIQQKIGDYDYTQNPLYNHKDRDGMTCLQLLANMPYIFESEFSMGLLKRFTHYCLPVNADELEESSTSHPFMYKALSKIYWAIWIFLAKGWPYIDEIMKKKKQHKAALALASSLALNDISWEESSEEELIVDRNLHESPSIDITEHTDQALTPLLLAASNGITEIVMIILDLYPQAIDHVSPEQQNILHVAIQRRQYKIFSLVKKMKMPMYRLVLKVDNKGNNILHQVAVVDYCREEAFYNPALLLQAELRLFERVKKLVPDHFLTATNLDNKTPIKYFEETHKEQLKKAREWSKDTSQSCSTVGALIATIVFAAAYTVPGGSEHGVPILLHKILFKVFTFMDMVSLGSALTSVVLFLSILSSPYRYRDFKTSIPGRMMFGFSFLLISVAATMVAFTVTILLTIKLSQGWSRSLIYLVGFLPVSIFALLHLPLMTGIQLTWRETRKTIKHFVPGFLYLCLKSNARTRKTEHGMHKALCAHQEV